MSLADALGFDLKPVLDKLELVEGLVRHGLGLVRFADLDVKVVQSEVASIKADVAAIKANVQELLDHEKD
jgi:hypothetical protein